MTIDYNLIIMELAKILLGGVIGIVGASYYKDFKDKKAERKKLFMRMITAKGFLKIPQGLVNDMNTITVLFRKKRKVLEKFHDYFDSLNKAPDQYNDATSKSLYWDLLREIGNIVGYKNLDNKTLNSFYIPNSAVEDYFSKQEFQQELLKYLKSGTELQKDLLEYRVDTRAAQVTTSEVSVVTTQIGQPSSTNGQQASGG